MNATCVCKYLSDCDAIYPTTTFAGGSGVVWFVYGTTVGARTRISDLGGRETIRLFYSRLKMVRLEGLEPPTYRFLTNVRVLPKMLF